MVFELDDPAATNQVMTHRQAEITNVRSVLYDALRGYSLKICG